MLNLGAGQDMRVSLQKKAGLDQLTLHCLHSIQVLEVLQIIIFFMLSLQRDHLNRLSFLNPGFKLEELLFILRLFIQIPPLLEFV